MLCIVRLSGYSTSTWSASTMALVSREASAGTSEGAVSVVVVVVVVSAETEVVVDVDEGEDADDGGDVGGSGV